MMGDPDTVAADQQQTLSVSDLDRALSKINKIIGNVEKVIFGKRDIIELVLIGMIADGHVLLEDVPGVGKTMLARALAKSLSAEFHRIQFTPDLLPADVTGSTTYNLKTQEFTFRKGPLFAHIVLADEINRTSPRTQSALLEGMEERQVTVDGTSYKLPHPFFVVATQNPIEQHGTYALPEAQLDRFMLRVSIGYPPPEQEVDILESQRTVHPLHAIEAISTPEDVIELQEMSRKVFVKPSLRKYVVDIASGSREHADVMVGISVRGAQMLMRASQAVALLNHREYMIPDDIQQVAAACLCHRLVMRPEAKLAGVTEEAVITGLIRQVDVPSQ